MSLRRCFPLLSVLFVALTVPGLRAQDPARPTREVVEQIVRETVQETNARVVTVGSWVSGSKYQDPLKGGTSDHDMRLLAPEGASPEAAQEAWRATRERIAGKVRARFPDKATADKVLSSINLYPPDEVLSGIDDATEALTTLKNTGINPNLGGAEVEGLWGKGSKAFRDAYEAKSGRMIYKEGDKVVSGFADLLPLGETRGIYTIEGSANAASQFVEKVVQAGKAGDARTVYKQLDRLNMSLRKGRSLGGLQQRNYFDGILAQLKPFENDPEGMLAYFKTHSADLSEQIAEGLRKAEPDAQLLKQFAKASNPRDVKILGEMLEEGTGKWARLKSSLSEASAHVPWGTLMHGLMAFFVYLETADIASTAGRGDAEQALERILSNLGFAASLPAGMLATMVTSILEDAKEAGYAMVTRFQDCEDLVAGIYEVKGREDISDQQKIETNIDELARAFTTPDQIRGVVALHARNASQRNAGEVTARVDAAVEAALNTRCGPIIITKWQKRRAAIIGEAAEQLMRAEAIFKTAYLTATAAPEPALLSPDGGLHGNVTVQARLGTDVASLTRAFTAYADTLTSLGGQSHEVAVSINHTYVWRLDGREIGKDAKMFVGVGDVFDAEAARRDVTLTTVGDHTVEFQYTLDVLVTSTVDDVFSVKRFLQKSFKPRTTVTLTAVEDTRPRDAAAAPPPDKDKPPVTPPASPPATAPPPAAQPPAGGAAAPPPDAAAGAPTTGSAAGGYWKQTRSGHDPQLSMLTTGIMVHEAKPSVTYATSSLTSRASGTKVVMVGKEVQYEPFTQQLVISWTELPKIIVPGVTYSTTVKMTWSPETAYVGDSSNYLGSELLWLSRTNPQQTVQWKLSDPSQLTMFQISIHGPGGSSRFGADYEWVAGPVPAQPTLPLEVTVSSTKPAPKLGDTVTLNAQASGGTAPYTYSWTGAASGASTALPFAVSKPGRNDFTVIVTDAKGAKTSAAFSVEAKVFTATILASGGALRVPMGQPLSFTAQVLSADGAAPPTDLVYRWQPNPEAKFTPIEGPSRQASAVFTRPGRIKVWVDVLQPSGGALATVAESNQLDIEVVAPTLTLRASPTDPYPGQEVRVSMTVAPASALDLISLRWEHVGAAISPRPLPGLREFTFMPKDVSPITAMVIAKSRDGGDDAGTAKISVTARPYVVTVTGPALMGPAPQQWDPKAGGLANVARQFQVFQQASMKATLAPAPPNAPRFAWTVTPDGCTLSNPISQEPTISCSQPGSFTASVSVTDANGAVLGSGSQSVSVAPQAAAATAPPPTAPTPPVVTTPTLAERQQTAGRLRAEAKALQDQGRLREAIAKYRESLTHVPDPALEAYIKQVEAAAARQETAAAPAPADTTNRDKAGVLRAEAKALQDRGQLREAVAKYRESLKYVPDPAMATYITQLEAEAARQERAAAQTKIEADKKAAALAAQQAEAAARDKAAQQAAAQAKQEEQEKAQATRQQQQAKATALRLRNEGIALQKQDKLREAAAKYRESLRYGPDPELETVIPQLEAELARRERAAQQAAETSRREEPARREEAAKREEAARQAPPPEKKPPAAERPSPPPPSKPAPPPAQEGCQVNGTYEFSSEDGSLSLALRQSGDQLDGTMTVSAPGIDAARAGLRGSISRSSFRLTASTPEGDRTLTGTAASDCRTIRVSITMEGDTQTFTLVRK